MIAFLLTQISKLKAAVSSLNSKIGYEQLQNVTSDANGNISLGITDEHYIVLSVFGSNREYIPFTYSGAWYVKVMASDANNTVLPEQDVASIWYSYMTI